MGGKHGREAKEADDGADDGAEPQETFVVTEEDRRKETEDAFEVILTIGVQYLREKPNSGVNNWSEDRIRADTHWAHIAVQKALETDGGKDKLRALRFDGDYKSEEDAKSAILAEAQRRYAPVRQAAVAVAPTLPAVAGWEYRYYTREFYDNEALNACILCKVASVNKNDFGVPIIERVLAIMAPTAPPAPANPTLTNEGVANYILEHNQPYVDAILAAYRQAYAELRMLDTQIGLTADHAKDFKF